LTSLYSARLLKAASMQLNQKRFRLPMLSASHLGLFSSVTVQKVEVKMKPCTTSPCRYVCRVEIPECQECLKKSHDDYGYNPLLSCCHCGKKFYARTWAKQYCSDQCQKVAAEERHHDRLTSSHKKICQNCGLSFMGTRRDALFCSNACRQKSHRNALRINKPANWPINISVTDTIRGQFDPLAYP